MQFLYQIGLTDQVVVSEDSYNILASLAISDQLPLIEAVFNREINVLGQANAPAEEYDAVIQSIVS